MYSKKVNRKISPAKRAPKRIRKELTKVSSSPLQVYETVRIAKNEPEAKPAQKKKSPNRKTPKKNDRKRPAKAGDSK